jgi:hypothetical protein
MFGRGRDTSARRGWQTDDGIIAIGATVSRGATGRFILIRTAQSWSAATTTVSPPGSSGC